MFFKRKVKKSLFTSDTRKPQKVTLSLRGSALAVLSSQGPQAFRYRHACL